MQMNQNPIGYLETK